jgi:hypothetical protein
MFFLYSPPNDTAKRRVVVTERQKTTYAVAIPHTHGRKPVVHTLNKRVSGIPTGKKATFIKNT